MDAIYLDNAATSFPKPEGVSDRMKYYLDCVGANVNRSVYTAAQEAGLVTLSLRQRLSELFRFPESPSHVILTPGATASLNILVAGLLRPGDHCIVSSMEHNAVMRPLLRLPGVEVSRIPCDREGFAAVDALEGLFRENTRLVLIAHGSNVSGTVQDAETIGRICAARGVPFALDGAQTAGHFPVDFQAMHLSALAVPGHKGLLGPGGIGALLVTDELARRMTPLIAGGTGSASDSEYLPDYLPDKFESGTANLPGCYGWEAAVRFVAERGVNSLRQHEMRLCQRFIEGLEEIHGEPVRYPHALRAALCAVGAPDAGDVPPGHRAVLPGVGEHGGGCGRGGGSHTRIGIRKTRTAPPSGFFFQWRKMRLPPP